MLYDMSGDFTLSREYGIFNIYLNDQLVGQNIDLAERRGRRMENIQFGEVSLKEGINTITIELVSPPQGSSRSHFGLDRLIFSE